MLIFKRKKDKMNYKGNFKIEVKKTSLEQTKKDFWDKKKKIKKNNYKKKLKKKKDLEKYKW
jgi:hypothetical protein